MRHREGLLLAAVLAVGLVVLLPAAPASACSCAMPSPVTRATLDDYDVVAAGEVTRNEADGDMQRRELDLAVATIWKGEAEATTEVVTHAQGSACGTDPPVGTEVLFLMTRGGDALTRDLVDDDELVVMACGGDRAASEAAALGPGRSPPAAAPDPADDDGGIRPGPVAAAGLAVAAGLAAAVVVGRRRAVRGDAA